MLKRRHILIAAFTAFTCLLLTPAEGQQVTGFRRGAASNPALAGAGGNGSISVSYMSLYPGSGYGLHNLYFSWDSFFEALNGGLGVGVSSEQSGNLFNDTRLNFSWSYHLRASRELYFFGGLSSGLIYRGFRNSSLIFPDQVDPISGPVLPTAEQVISPYNLLFDMGAGFSLIYREMLFSVDMAHLFRPYLSQPGAAGTRLPVCISAQFFTRLNTGAGDLFAVPYLEATLSGNYRRVSAGGVLEYKNLGTGVLWLITSAGNAMQPSFSAGTGRLRVSYSVRVGLSGRSGALPLMLMHQAGITTGLNIVDKRKAIRAIYLPEL